MEFNEVIKARRSIRKYKNTPVDEATIKELISSATYAPSWKNSQVTRYYVVSGDNTKEMVKSALPEFNQRNIMDAPTLVVTTIVANHSGFNNDGTPTNELANGWGCYDCGLNNMVFLLKAAELGLGTLVMGIRDEVKIKEILNISEDEIVVSVIGLGYADIDPEMPKRKTVEDIAKFYND